MQNIILFWYDRLLSLIVYDLFIIFLYVLLLKQCKFFSLKSIVVALFISIYLWQFNVAISGFYWKAMRPYLIFIMVWTTWKLVRHRLREKCISNYESRIYNIRKWLLLLLLFFFVVVVLLVSVSFIYFYFILQFSIWRRYNVEIFLNVNIKYRINKNKKKLTKNSFI